MDETPKCSHDIQPIPQKSTQKDQSGGSKDEPAYSEDQTSTPKTQTALTKDQPTYSKDQPAYSKTQNVLTIDLAMPKEQSTTQKLQIVLKDESSTKAQSPSPKNQIVALIGNSSGRRSPINPESRILATLSYSENNSYLGYNAPLIIKSSTQPLLSQLPLPVGDAAVAIRTQPQSLLLQALSKLNESPLNLSVINHLKLLQSTANLTRVFNFDLESGEITPPDSLTSAPPSYSFVLRQMAVRRRPRFMGTFYPSPSFVQHTPPPTYTTPFDVYFEPALPPPPARVYTFGFAPMLIVCPECGYTGLTVVTSRITICTHLCAFILCLLCCWICAPLPYILRSCKDVYHYCSNCRSFLGMYCPTNPNSVYT